MWLMGQALGANEVPCAWIAPTYKQAKIAFRYFRKIFRNAGVFAKEPNKSNLEIEIIGGNLIQFRTGANPEFIEGEGYKAIVMDEAWNLLQNELLWYESIRPTLIDYGGRCLFISKGDFEETLLYELYQKGLRKEDDYVSYTAPTWENPIIPASEIEYLRKELPPQAFEQQIEGKFLSTKFRPIPNIEECAIAPIETTHRSKNDPYIMGLDLAKVNDYTVITIGRRGAVVYYERFNKLSWPVQEKKIVAVAQKYNAKIIMDSTGIGDPIHDHLCVMGLSIEPQGYNFSTTTRARLLDLLILRMSQRLFAYPPDFEVAITEMKSMRWKITASGRPKLEVPEGKHDDCIFSLALCCWGMSGFATDNIEADHFGSAGEVESSREH